AEVEAAYAEVTAAGRAAGADVRGALVQPMRDGGIELLVGVVTDPAWGQVLAVGFGGVWVEILRDTALQVLPAGRDQVLQSLRSLLEALEVNPLLVRGSQVEALDALITWRQP